MVNVQPTFTIGNSPVIGTEINLVMTLCRARYMEGRNFCYKYSLVPKRFLRNHHEINSAVGSVRNHGFNYISQLCPKMRSRFQGYRGHQGLTGEMGYPGDTGDFVSNNRSALLRPTVCLRYRNTGRSAPRAGEPSRERLGRSPKSGYG